ncbi:MAG: lysozyme [Alphaproteobacteria bacterium]|nr:lysozyme [Alphaproteobacteria bacterium]
MLLNDAGYALLKTHEGLRLKAYLCAGGVLTIGYGHTGDVTPLQVMTTDAAEQLLKKDVMRFEDGVSRYVCVPLNENQFSALVCFAFNVGLGAFAGSTLLSLLNRGWYTQVPAQLMRWTKARGVELPGLVARRRDEAELWNRKV